MGLIVSRLRRRKSTLQLLQTIQNELDGIEQYYKDEESGRCRSLTVRYLLFFCTIGWLLFYFYLPKDIYTRVLYATLLLLPLPMIFMTKRVLSFYHNKKMKRKDARRTVLLKEKKSLLDQVQENETYKVAKQILEEFAPELLRRSPMRPQTVDHTSTLQANNTIRQRSAAPPNNSQALSVVSPISSVQQRLNQHRQAMMSTHLTPSTPNAPSHIRPRSPLPRPILNRERGYLDRVMDALVGDGPSNRYALICSQCHGHNGMALREEFQYLAFRCCYCHGWNPARKQRPSAPRLPVAGQAHVISSTDTDQSDSTDSGDDGDAPQPRSVPGTELSSSPSLPTWHQLDGSERGTGGNERAEESITTSDGHQSPNFGGDSGSSNLSQSAPIEEEGGSGPVTARSQVDSAAIYRDSGDNCADVGDTSATAGFQPQTDSTSQQSSDNTVDTNKNEHQEENTHQKVPLIETTSEGGMNGECRSNNDDDNNHEISDTGECDDEKFKADADCDVVNDECESVGKGDGVDNFRVDTEPPDTKEHTNPLSNVTDDDCTKSC